MIFRLSRSDSSMDDCNCFIARAHRAISVVQIPLWTIVTLRRASSHDLDLCSDSSMDDCNGLIAIGTLLYKNVQIPLWTIVTSSLRRSSCINRVQIPLWTIVTLKERLQRRVDDLSSDSSMDDCNREVAV